MAPPGVYCWECKQKEHVPFPTDGRAPIDYSVSQLIAAGNFHERAVKHHEDKMRMMRRLASEKMDTAKRASGAAATARSANEALQVQDLTRRPGFQVLDRILKAGYLDTNQALHSRVVFPDIHQAPRSRVIFPDIHQAPRSPD